MGSVPQAMLVAPVRSLPSATALVWAELGAALPGPAGRTVTCVKSIASSAFSPWFSFCSRCRSFKRSSFYSHPSVGLAGYASYCLARQSRTPYLARNLDLSVPLWALCKQLVGASQAPFLAIGVLASCTCSSIPQNSSIGWLSKLLLAGVLGDHGWIISPGLHTAALPSV